MLPVHVLVSVAVQGYHVTFDSVKLDGDAERSKRGTLTSWEVVAYREPGAHVLEDGTCRAELSSTANTGGGLPNNLGVVTPVLEVAHIRGRLAIRIGWEEVDFAIVPHVGNCLSNSCGGTKGFRICSGTIDRDVLTVSTSAGRPARVSMMESGGKLKVPTNRERSGSWRQQLQRNQQSWYCMSKVKLSCWRDEDCVEKEQRSRSHWKQEQEQEPELEKERQQLEPWR
jgi:hypothetical protein